MSGLIQDFLSGAQRVTARIYYYIPLNEGQEALKVPSPLIGHKPQEFHHRGVLQEFAWQEDDIPDVDERLAEIFYTLVNTSGGIIKIQDRKQRIHVMTEEAQLAPQRETAEGKSLQGQGSIVVPQIMIPTPREEAQSTMKGISDSFKAAVPFPKLRSFLQFWQAEIDGPLNHLQFVNGSLVEAGYRRQYVIN